MSLKIKIKLFVFSLIILNIFFLISCYNGYKLNNPFITYNDVEENKKDMSDVDNSDPGYQLIDNKSDCYNFL